MATALCSPRDVYEALTLVWPLFGGVFALYNSQNRSLVIAAPRMTEGQIGLLKPY